MKCLIVLFSLLAVSLSFPYESKNVSVDKNGTITIQGVNGRKITITRPSGENGPKNVEIDISGPNQPTKRIEINDHNEVSGPRTVNLWEGEKRQNSARSVDEDYLRDKRSKSTTRNSRTQGDVLAEILKQFEGNINETQYEKLMSQVKQAVTEGHLNAVIYDMLKSLNELNSNPSEGLNLQQQQFLQAVLERQQQKVPLVYARQYPYYVQPYQQVHYQPEMVYQQVPYQFMVPRVGQAMHSGVIVGHMLPNGQVIATVTGSDSMQRFGNPLGNHAYQGPPSTSQYSMLGNTATMQGRVADDSRMPFVNPMDTRRQSAWKEMFVDPYSTSFQQSRSMGQNPFSGSFKERMTDSGVYRQVSSDGMQANMPMPAY